MHKNTAKCMIYIVTGVLFIIGLCIYLYPLVTGYILERNSGIAIKNFENLRKVSYNENSESSDNETEEELADIQKNNLSKLYDDMKEYNNSIYTSGQSGLRDAWSYEQSGFELSAYGIGDEAVAVLRIPKMDDLVMPIYLGASRRNMSRGAAQLGETSMPIGGNNTNCVIAGHRGWNGAKYFVDIEKLELGDLVYIDNFWTTLTYKVCDIQVISPSDIHKVLIQPNRDMVTLITCHPYMRSSSRYVVFCERTDSDGQSLENGQNFDREQGSENGQNSETVNNAGASNQNEKRYSSSQILIRIGIYSYIAVPVLLIFLVIVLKQIF